MRTGLCTYNTRLWLSYGYWRKRERPKEVKEGSSSSRKQEQSKESR